MWDSSGPALETVINSIVEVPAAHKLLQTRLILECVYSFQLHRFLPEAPAVTVEPGTECAICLETDAADGSSWKALPCHHAFHEDMGHDFSRSAHVMASGLRHCPQSQDTIAP